MERDHDFPVSSLEAVRIDSVHFVGSRSSWTVKVLTHLTWKNREGRKRCRELNKERTAEREDKSVSTHSME